MDRQEFRCGEECGHPVDLAELFAETMGWQFAREDDDQLVIEYAGLWRFYTVVLNWHQNHELLTVRNQFELNVPESAESQLLDAINRANVRFPGGSFTLHLDEEMIAYSLSHTLAGDAELTVEQLENLINNSISQCEVFYPAFQMVALGVRRAESAIDAAIVEPISHC